MRTSGIYRIVHVASEREYIGQSQDIFARWQRHRSMLRSQTHHARHLCAAWHKYGEAAFAFDILELCDVANLDAAEQRWIDHRRPAFNTAQIAGSTRGVVPSDETRRKLSAAGAGRRQPIETRQKIREALTGRKFSDEHRANLCGRIKGDAEIEAMRAKLTGRKLSDEHRAKVSVALTGRPVGEQQRQKMRDAMVGRPKTAEHRQKLREAALRRRQQ